MSLFIKDPKVGALASELQAIMSAPTKTEAVRAAILEKIELEKKKIPPVDTLAKIRADLRARFGEPNPDFEFKKFTDDLYDGM
jgi:antitoxin VapB